MSEQALAPVERVITEEERKKCLQSALYYFTQQQPFVGSMLQELTMKYSVQVPTAGITFSKKLDQFEIYINPNFFCNLTGKERVAVLHHEILHFTNKHLFRLPFMDVPEEERKLYNMAGDMSINQYITDLPKGCIDVKEWKLDTGAMFPLHQGMETYYDLLKNNKKNNKEQNDKYKDFDVHDWEQLDEETKEKMLQEARKIVKRTIEKTQYSHTSVPKSIQDLLEDIEGMAAGLNYKQILKDAIKRSASVCERQNTWKRPNKRYGMLSPGSKLGELPVLAFFNDSSGSISISEQNEYLRIMDRFLTVGARNCSLSFWHTDLYYKKPYKKGRDINREDIQSGGTDVTCVMEEIRKSKPDLSLILTDGFFDRADVEVGSADIIWIISKNGNADHPMRHVGKTILLDNLKD